jgi:rhodanese-related sulfurtransferase
VRALVRLPRLLIQRYLSRRRSADLSPEMLEQWLAEGQEIRILDIRGPAAFAAGHLPGAVNVPLERLPGALGQLDRSAPTVVY